MQISVPENLGGKLRVLPEDSYNAQIQDIYLGKSQSGNPKATVKWVITTEYSGKKTKNHITTIGENVLETFSLQPQALWNLNSLYLEHTGEKIPQGDYDEESFVQMLKSALVGAEFQIDIQTDAQSGEERSVVADRRKE